MKASQAGATPQFFRREFVGSSRIMAQFFGMVATRVSPARCALGQSTAGFRQELIGLQAVVFPLQDVRAEPPPTSPYAPRWCSNCNIVLR